jgi:hypothetical protein
MITPPHRTDEMKAKYAADRFARSQKDLNELLSQFPLENRQRILDRLTPHLTFEPVPLGGTTPQEK